LDNCARIKKEEKINICGYLKDIKTVVSDVVEEIIRLKSSPEGKIDRFIDEQQKVNKIIVQKLNYPENKKSFALALKSGITLESNIQRTEPTKVAIIRPKNDKTKCNESEHVIKMAIKQNNKNIAINEIKYVSNGGLAISCRSEKEQEELIELCNEKINKDYVATKPKQKQPRIAIYGIESDIQDSEILDDITNKNEIIKAFFDDNPGEKVEDHLKLKFRYGSRPSVNRTSDTNSTITTTTQQKWTQKSGHSSQTDSYQTRKSQTCVFELSTEMWLKLCGLRSIYIGFRSCRFSEYLFISRCYRCNGFGHKAADCKQINSSCGYCGHNHDSKQCESKENLFCVNCDKSNKMNKSMKTLSTNHSVYDSNCASLKRIKEIIRSRINYG
jgi:hypothetical protein